MLNRNKREEDSKISFQQNLTPKDNKKLRLFTNQPIKQLKVLQTKFFTYLNELNSSIQNIQKERTKQRKHSRQRQRYDSVDSCSVSQHNSTDNTNSNMKNYSNLNTYPNYQKDRSQSLMKQKSFKQHLGFLKKQIQVFEKIQEDNKAKLYFQDGSLLLGEAKNGEIQYGIMNFADGKKYQGNFKDFKFHGYGKLTLPSGTVYKSIFDSGKMLKNGEIMYENGECYKGQIQNFKKHGFGELKFTDGKRYMGNFYKGQITGFGIYYVDDMQIDGLWAKGQLVQKCNSKTKIC